MPKLKSHNEDAKLSLVENDIKILSEEEYLKSTGLKKLKKKIKIKTKEQILASLDDFQEIDQEKMWNEIYSRVSLIDNVKTSVPQASMMIVQGCIPLFQRYAFSVWQYDIFVPFIHDVMNWHLTNSKVDESKKNQPSERILGTKVKGHQDNKLTFYTNENGMETLTNVFNVLYEEKLIPARFQVNTKIDEYFDQNLINKFLDTLDIELSVMVENEDLFYMTLGHLLFNKFINNFSPFDEYKKSIAKQKKINVFKKLYIESLDNPIISIFIFEHIDTDNNVCWMRDIFTFKLYPVIDLAVTQDTDTTFTVFYSHLVPILKRDNSATMYIHGGSNGMINPHLDHKKLDRIDKSQFGFSDFSRMIIKEFLITYEVYKLKFWTEIVPNLKAINYTGDLEVLEKYYVTMMTRID